MSRSESAVVRLVAFLVAAWSASLLAADVQGPIRPQVEAFITEMAGKHAMGRAELRALLQQARLQRDILRAMSTQSTARPWRQYRPLYVNPQRVAGGTKFWAAHAALLARAEREFGVPAELIVATIGVETVYGSYMGTHRVLDALTTLAFDFPRRAEFFRGELEQFLLMTREESLDPLAPLGSYAGAMGIPQFMPTSFRKWAVDGDGDGVRDLWKDWADVFASVGNYLKVHGWEPGAPIMVPADATGADLAGVEFGRIGLAETVGSLRARGVKFDTPLPDATPATLVALAVGFGTEYRVGFANFHAITRYNRSHMYASAVNDLAQAIGVAVAASRAAPPEASPETVAPASS